MPKLAAHVPRRSQFGSDVAADRGYSTIISFGINRRSAQLLYEPLYRANERGRRNCARHLQGCLPGLGTIGSD